LNIRKKLPSTKHSLLSDLVARNMSQNSKKLRLNLFWKRNSENRELTSVILIELKFSEKEETMLFGETTLCYSLKVRK